MRSGLFALPAVLGLVLGFRHGLDWDQLTAIGDMVGSPAQSSRRSMVLAVWYSAGHGFVSVLLGIAVGLMGVRLPHGLDRIFEALVGSTLVLLGILVLWQLGKSGGGYQYGSRWMLLFDLLRRAWLRHRGEGAGDRAAPNLSSRAAFGIGLLHGTGAETPTQLLLFASAAAAGSIGGAGLILGAFVVGLLASDLLIAAAWLSGRLAGRRAPALRVGMGVLTGISSVAVGLFFVSGQSGLLPALLGG